MSAIAIPLMHAARVAEKEQALFYRALASAAEEIPDELLSERLNGLHADEQHHLSRLTVRLLELGEPVVDLGMTRAPVASLGDWEAVARARELSEITRYEKLLAQELDAKTRGMIAEFLESEHYHADHLGGKWMSAEP